MRRPLRWRLGQGGWTLLLLVALAVFLRVQPEAQPEPASGAPAFVSPQGVYYRNCRAAHQAGRTNIRRGEAGYRAQLDADGDGLACEPVLIPRRD